MRPLRLLAATTVAAMALTACSSGGGDGGGGDAPEVAATVGGTEIPGSRIDEIVASQAGLIEATEDEQADQQRRELERSALSAEIQLAAVETAVEERFGLDISDEEVDARLQEQIEEQGGQEAFDQLAEEQGIDGEAALGLARDNAYVQVLVEYVQGQLADEGGITEEELRAQYEADPSAYQTSQVRHILVETEEEANDVLARLDDGEDFGELAMELSTDPGSGANGGELGEAPRGSYVGPFEEAVWNEDNELGELLGPIETQFGFHLIIVDDRTTRSFEEVRPELEAQLSGTAFTEFLDSVFEELEVEVDEYYGEWDPTSRSVIDPDAAQPQPDLPVEPPAEAPATEAPATDAPASEAPATEAPASEAPATEEPTEDATSDAEEPTAEPTETSTDDEG